MSSNVYIIGGPTASGKSDYALVDQGNTVIVIEHNLEVIKTGDWIIDLGPEGGFKGGKIVATGTPEQISQTKKSYTGQYLRPYLQSS